jgi:hypothetical protein
MKKIIFLFFFLFSSKIFVAQYGLKIVRYRPTGDMGMALKPTFSGELTTKSFDDEDKKWKPRFGLGFIHFAPRLDTIPTNGVIVSSNGSTVTPGYMVIHKYNIAYFYGGFDRQIKLSKIVFLYPGIDIGVGFIFLNYDSRTELISEQSYSGGSMYIGIRPRLGMEFKMNEKARLFFETVRNMNMIPHQSFFAYNDYGIGIRYNFKKQ